MELSQVTFEVESPIDAVVQAMFVLSDMEHQNWERVYTFPGIAFSLCTEHNQQEFLLHKTGNKWTQLLHLHLVVFLWLVWGVHSFF